MIPILKLTISRSVDDGGDLVISNVLEDGARFLLPDDGLGFPTFPYRYEYAPDSPVMVGKELLGAVLDQGTVPAVVHVFGDSIGDLLDARAELEAILAQPAYTVAITFATTVLGPWDAAPISPNWGDAIDFGLAAQAQTRASLQFLVNP